MVFLNAIVRFVPLNVFACFCNISFVFMHFCAFMCSCVVLPLWHALAPCMVHGIGMHVMHHVIIVVIIVMFIIMLIMFVMIIIMFIIHCSLINR